MSFFWKCLSAQRLERLLNSCSCATSFQFLETRHNLTSYSKAFDWAEGGQVILLTQTPATCTVVNEKPAWLPGATVNYSSSESDVLPQHDFQSVIRLPCHGTQPLWTPAGERNHERWRGVVGRRFVKIVGGGDSCQTRHIRSICLLINE